MDYQAYVMMQTWSKPYVMWLMSRGGGKTVLAAVYYMTKLLLIPNYTVYVGATKAEQAIESFTKLEQIATRRAPSFKTLTDIFKHEVYHAPGAGPFSHDPAGYRFSLYNGSMLKTLSSNKAGSRGKRGSMWYDESAFIDRDFIDVCDKFIAVDANFETSVGLSTKQPEQMPFQLLYTSSASSVTSAFYDRFRDYTKHMLAGDSNYFVCDLDVNLILDHSSIDGELIKSHISQETVDKDRKDPDSFAREYLNHFTSGAGKHAVISEDCLVRNSYTRLPTYYNDTGKRKFILCYDPARNYDNSVLGIFELIYDKEKGYHMDVVNVISMVNEKTEKKTPLNYVEQLKIIQQAMIEYNGHDALEWENIEFWIDAGSGGAPRSGIADQLLFPWTDDKGKEHRGIIDPDDPQYETDRRQHPRNAKIVHLLEPKKYKSKIFGALEEMSDLDLIHFTQYDGRRDYILLPEGENGEYKEHRLSQKEKLSLLQIELMKKEISYMIRTETPSTKSVTYELTRERRYKMHDDRAYVLAMGAYVLWRKRNADLRARKVEGDRLVFKARAPKLRKRG